MPWAIAVFLLWTLPAFPTHQLLPELQHDPFSSGVPTLLLDSLQLTLSRRLLLDVLSPRGPVLKGYLGWLPLESDLQYSSCDQAPTHSVCLRYGADMTLLVTQDPCEGTDMSCHATPCHRIRWSNHVGGAMDCFVLGEDHWYGGGQDLAQEWPLQSDSRPWYPAVTGDPLHHPSGGVSERTWLSSSGFVIHVDDRVPLFVSFNESGSGKLCFSTSTRKHPYRGVRDIQELSYTICSAMSVRDAQSFAAHRWYAKPSNIPEEALLRRPVWSTWARYKRDIDAEVLREFANEIRGRGFPIGQLEIDDKWEDCYGSLEFDRSKFPNPKKAIGDLEVQVSLWVHPFCNVECEICKTSESKQYFVKNGTGDVYLVKWWNGVGAVLDTTNPEAVRWFSDRLRVLKHQHGVASFKFDAGELLWFDSDFKFFDPEADSEPNTFSKAYAELAASFGSRVEVRVGYKSQDLPVLVRMYDKNSRWDADNGLRTLIPSALQLSVMGYLFVLPDMVGGNNYDSTNGSLPDRELYIRWLQASLFLPTIQFSITPWDYDEELERIALKMLDMRSKHDAYILQVARQSLVNGEPIIRPLWWISPDDSECLTNDSEFLVGDEILVAPVLEKGRRRRDIYLPDGIWTDVQRGKTYDGSQWLLDYSAPLDFLPYFISNLQKM